MIKRGEDKSETPVASLQLAPLKVLNNKIYGSTNIDEVSVRSITMARAAMSSKGLPMPMSPLGMDDKKRHPSRGFWPKFGSKVINTATHGTLNEAESKKVSKKVLPAPSISIDSDFDGSRDECMIFVCGPQGFMDEIQEIVEKAGYPPECVTLM